MLPNFFSGDFDHSAILQLYHLLSTLAISGVWVLCSVLRVGDYIKIFFAKFLLFLLNNTNPKS